MSPTYLTRFFPLSETRVSFHACGQASGKTFEPQYLDAGGLTPPAYPKINIQMKGFDFDILESYQSYVHNLAENIGIDVSDCWATPCESFAASTYVPQSTKIKDVVKMHIYERNVQIDGVTSVELPVLVDVLRKTLPAGVSLSVHKHQNQHYEARFIPDPFIDGIRAELEGIETERNEELAKKRAEREAKGKK